VQDQFAGVNFTDLNPTDPVISGFVTNGGGAGVAGATVELSEDALTSRRRCTSIRCMRTTLDIDDDVLQAAKDLARREKKTAGQMISELVRRALGASPAGAGAKEPKPLYGLRPFPRRGGIVTNELIDKLREDAAY